MPSRRSEDLSIAIMTAVATPAPPLVGATDHGHLTIHMNREAAATGSGTFTAAVSTFEKSALPVLVVRVQGGALLVAGGEVERIVIPDGASLMQFAAREVVAWRRRAVRLLRHRHASDRLLALVELLNRQETDATLFTAVMLGTTDVVGGDAAIVFVPDEEAPAGSRALRALPNDRCALTIESVGSHAFEPIQAPGLIGSDDAPGPASSGLKPLFDATGAARIAHVPVGDGGVLAVIERRSGREFDAEDWFRLGAIARYTNVTLERIRLRTRVAALEAASHAG